MWYYQTNDELMHYGVLGMKWGQHKATQQGGTYEYKSLSTKKWEKRSAKYAAKSEALSAKGKMQKRNGNPNAHASLNKASKMKAKAEKTSRFASRSAEHDRRMQSASKNANVKNVVAANALLGLWANKTYHSLMSSGYSKNAAIAYTGASSYLGLGPITAAVAKSRYIRSTNDYVDGHVGVDPIANKKKSSGRAK